MLAVLNKLYFSYKFPTFKNGQPGCHKIPVEELLHYNASALLEAIDKDKYGRHEVYTWLQDAAKRDFAPVAITNWPYRLAPRGVRPPTERKRIATNTPSTTGAFAFPSPEEESPSDTSRSSSRVGKTLRPPGRRAGKKSSLRLVTTSRKRPHSDVESNSESEETNPKRSHYFADGDDVTSDADNGDSSRGDDEADEEPIKIVIRADKIPSTVPHGPSETWTCDQEDCDYVVRGGDEEQCQERIRKHFEEHEAQMDRVNLAMTESRGHLPIKYAYFPPFLILVEFDPSTDNTTDDTPLPNPNPNPQQDPLPSSPTNPPGLSRSTQDNFQVLVNQFRRRPHPVSDSLGKLTFP